jgi:hypothetical protein
MARKCSTREVPVCSGVLPIFRDNDAMNRAFDLHRAGITDDSL